jgi:hypothetical protein
MSSSLRVRLAGVASGSFFVRTTGVEGNSVGNTAGERGGAAGSASGLGAGFATAFAGTLGGELAFAPGGGVGRCTDATAATSTPSTPASSPSFASFGIGPPNSRAIPSSIPDNPPRPT